MDSYTGEIQELAVW